MISSRVIVRRCLTSKLGAIVIAARTSNLKVSTVNHRMSTSLVTSLPGRVSPGKRGKRCRAFYCSKPVFSSPMLFQLKAPFDRDCSVQLRSNAVRACACYFTRLSTRPWRKLRLRSWVGGVRGGKCVRICANGKGKGAATTFKLTVQILYTKKDIFVKRFMGGVGCGRAGVRRLFGGIHVRRFNQKYFVRGGPTRRSVSTTCTKLRDYGRVLTSKRCGLIILSRLAVTLCCRLLSVRRMLATVSQQRSKARLMVAKQCTPTRLVSVTSLIARVQRIGRCCARNILSHGKVSH